MGNNTHELDEVEVLERELLQDEEVEEILDDLPKIEREIIESYMIRKSGSVAKC